MNTELSIISKQTTGILLIVGILVIFVATIFLMLPIYTVTGMLLILFIIASFLYKPLFGFLTIVILRASIDFLSSYFSLSISENVQLNIASILALLLISSSLLLIILHWKIILKAPLLIPFSIFILFSGLSFFYSIDKASTIQETLRLLSIFLSFLTAYILTLKIPQARKTIISVILFSALIPIAFALFQLLTGTGFTDSTGTEGRLFGTFSQPNAFASFLIILISIFIYKIYSTTVLQSEKNFYITLLLFTILLLIFTFSRGGWLAGLIFFTIFSLLKAPKLLFITISIGIILFFTSQAIHERVEDIYNPPSDSSIRWRLEQWKGAISAWELSPIYGHGSGTEVAIHEQEQGFHAGNPYTHNDLIKALQEMGIIGFILFLLLLIATFITLLKQYHKLTNPDAKLFTLVILLLFISEIIFGMSSNIWRSTAIQWLLWILIASALSQQNKVAISTNSTY
jgi:O-antigen ligase